MLSDTIDHNNKNSPPVPRTRHPESHSFTLAMHICIIMDFIDNPHEYHTQENQAY